MYFIIYLHTVHSVSRPQGIHFIYRAHQNNNEKLSAQRLGAVIPVDEVCGFPPIRVQPGKKSLGLAQIAFFSDTHLSGVSGVRSDASADRSR